jgi:hypothetical protein
MKHLCTYCFLAGVEVDRRIIIYHKGWLLLWSRLKWLKIWSSGRYNN